MLFLWNSTVCGPPPLDAASYTYLLSVRPPDSLYVSKIFDEVSVSSSL